MWFPCAAAVWWKCVWEEGFGEWDRSQPVRWMLGPSGKAPASVGPGIAELGSATGFPVGSVPMRGAEAPLAQLAASPIGAPGTGGPGCGVLGRGGPRGCSVERPCACPSAGGRRGGYGYRFSCGIGARARCRGAWLLGYPAHLWGVGGVRLPVLGSGALRFFFVGPAGLRGWRGSVLPAALTPRISFPGHAGPGTLVRDAGSASFTRGAWLLWSMALGSLPARPPAFFVSFLLGCPRISFPGHAGPGTLVHDAGSASFAGRTLVTLVHGTVSKRTARGRAHSLCLGAVSCGGSGPRPPQPSGPQMHWPRLLTPRRSRPAGLRAHIVPLAVSSAQYPCLLYPAVGVGGAAGSHTRKCERLASGVRGRFCDTEWEGGSCRWRPWGRGVLVPRREIPPRCRPRPMLPWGTTTDLDWSPGPGSHRDGPPRVVGAVAGLVAHAWRELTWPWLRGVPPVVGWPRFPV